VSNLKSANIDVIGAGEYGDFGCGLNSVEYLRDDYCYAFVGVCLRDEKYAFSGGADFEELLGYVTKLASQNKIVILSIHWGDELMDRPSSKQKVMANRLVNAGVKIIIGHHPHVVQGIEQIGNSLVAYSLGNFIFDSYLPDTRWSMILQIKMKRGNIEDWKYTPVKLNSKHQPKIPDPDLKEKLENEIKRRNELLKLPQTDQNDSNYIKEWKKKDIEARTKLYKLLLKRFFFINPRYSAQILLRPIIRRIGKW